MPDTFTPNLNLTKPEIGASADVWGNKTNADWDIIDALFAAAGAGTVIRRNAAGNAALGPGAEITGASGTARIMSWLTGTLLRWTMRANVAAEVGANAGSDFTLTRYDDSGVVIDNPITIPRATGVVAFPQVPTVAGSPLYYAGNLPGGGLPIGSIGMYVGLSDPAGGFYLLCDGRAISRTTFAALFAVIGTQFGAGDGTTTFNIPNTAERVIIGKSPTQTLIPQFDARAMGNSFGEGRHVQLPGELASHVHTITDPGHVHGLTYHNANNNPATGGGAVVDRINPTGEATAINTAPHTTGIAATDNAGSSAPMNVVQPSIVMNFIIRVQ